MELRRTLKGIQYPWCTDADELFAAAPSLKWDGSYGTKMYRTHEGVMFAWNGNGTAIITDAIPTTGGGWRLRMWVFHTNTSTHDSLYFAGIIAQSDSEPFFEFFLDEPFGCSNWNFKQFCMDTNTGGARAVLYSLSKVLNVAHAKFNGEDEIEQYQSASGMLPPVL